MDGSLFMGGGHLVGKAVAGLGPQRLQVDLDVRKLGPVGERDGGRVVASSRFWRTLRNSA
jgi:hypothetical protein